MNVNEANIVGGRSETIGGRGCNARRGGGGGSGRGGSSFKSRRGNFSRGKGVAHSIENMRSSRRIARRRIDEDAQPI